MQYEICPLTLDRWSDLEELFGDRGGTEGCWCMFWRLSSGDYQANRGEANKLALKKLTGSQIVPGLLAYDGKQPVGWCSLGRREDFGRIQRSTTLKPVDDTPVWSIVCFFIHRQYRRKGVATALLHAAVDFARLHGAEMIEGYPIEGEVKNAFAFTGIPIMFSRLGFKVAAKRGKRIIMRLTLKEG
jgi:GNAT superfamily N-acetyltransferase